MKTLSMTAKALLVTILAPVLFLALLSLPLALLQLLPSLFREATTFLFPPIAIYAFAICLPVGLFQWFTGASGGRSNRIRIARGLWVALASAITIGLGQVLLSARITGLFWLFFLAGAALPPMTALAIAANGLGGITTWRRIIAGIISGSWVSTHLTLLLSAFVFVIVYLLVAPLREFTASMISSRSLEKLFYSPALMLALIGAAIVAPLVEELTKPVAAFLLAKKLQSSAEAFLIGMAGGVGFAILENMLYEGAGARMWGHITLLRAIGGVLHPLNAGLVAVGWYGVRNNLPGAWGRLFGLYGIAVGLHAIWNGALTILYSNIGSYFLGTETWSFSIYGIGQPGIVMIFMLVQSVAMWRLLAVVVGRLREPAGTQTERLLEFPFGQPRILALCALIAAVLVVPVGALYGPSVTRYIEVAWPLR